MIYIKRKLKPALLHLQWDGSGTPHCKYRIFSHARRLSEQHVYQGKIYLFKFKTTSSNKVLAKKNILLSISYTQYTKHIRFYLPLPINVTVSIFIVSAFIFLTLTLNISILLNDIPQPRLTVCPETSVRNYYSTLHNISLYCRPHIIWRCRPLFGSTWSGSERCGMVRSVSALHKRI